jgi:hypothetical protein
VTETKALQLIAAALAAGRVEFTYHALNESMPDRGLSVSDVLGALESATAGEPQNDEGTKWKVFGRLLNDEELAIVVRIREQRIIVIITAHAPP